jgi:glutamyl-tRNA reductase
VIVCLSASYKKTQLPLLESMVFKEADTVMRALRSEYGLEECALLQTCNRIEIYGVVNNAAANTDSIGRILGFWSANTGVSLDILARNVELLKGRDALVNIFNVASGLDSMAVGEDQILGQVRNAYTRAKELGSLGVVLDRLFMCAINTGRKVRTETRIDEGSVSISSAAIDLAAKELGDLKRTTALVIGAGDAGSVAAETLRRRGAKSIAVANRTYETAVRLAEKISGKAAKFESIYQALSRVDLAIVALSVDSPVIKAARLKEAVSKKGRSRRLLVVDISQPRAVETEVGNIEGVKLRNIDGLKDVIDETIRVRQVEAEKAHRILLEELTRFERQQSQFLIQSLLSEIYRQVELIRQNELRRAMNKMAEKDERKLQVLERFSRELMERILQIPAEQLKRAALDSDDSLVSAAQKLFKVK